MWICRLPRLERVIQIAAEDQDTVGSGFEFRNPHSAILKSVLANRCDTFASPVRQPNSGGISIPTVRQH